MVVLSGPSAVGKSTVVRCLRERIPNLHFSVSATTRAPRPGEVDGVDYHFVTPESFQQMIDQGELLEWAEIHGGLHRSGTPAQPVREATASGVPVLIEVDLAGAGLSRRRCPRLSACFWRRPVGRTSRPGWSVGALRRRTLFVAGYRPRRPNWQPNATSTRSW
ncbi:guanylate kinase [Mycobacterium ulcerans str. Harvey]|uniref:Guanylate kinase n=1 Tax=Mycobacterium ulcerans str. Harvey TaxID=1299332 RepID=A0ABP3ALI2_MYCUL|nr:guanylate kinase [Mycobacterium ulcerans str. Harvey]